MGGGWWGGGGVEPRMCDVNCAQAVLIVVVLSCIDTHFTCNTHTHTTIRLSTRRVCVLIIDHRLCRG